MTLDRILLKDFQAHEGLAVNIDPGITVVIGATDAGKSAIIRALKWLATNRPAGDAFIRDGARSTAVELTVDGTRILRGKGKDGNVYKIGEHELKAFGTDVPDAVTELLNLSFVNFQGQHDAPFWFSDTAGEVSRQLNRIVDLGLIDKTLSNLASTLRKARAEEEVVTERQQAARKERRSLRFVPTMQAQMTELKHLEEEARLATTQGSLLQSLLDTCSGLHQALESQRRCERALVRCTKAGDHWAALHDQRIALESVVDSVQSLRTLAEQKVPDVDPLISKHRTWIAIRLRSRILALIVLDSKNLRTRHRQLAQRLEETTQEFNTAMGDTCPLCGKPIEDDLCPKS